jgi:hypothetical protein
MGLIATRAVLHHHKIKYWSKSTYISNCMLVNFKLALEITLNHHVISRHPSGPGKRHYELHLLKIQSNAKLADIEGIFGHDKSIDAGVVEFVNIANLFGLAVVPNKRDMCLLHRNRIL